MKKETRTDCEKIFAKYMSDKGLIFKIVKEPLKINNKKTNSPTKQKNERNISTDTSLEMTNKYVKICSTSFVIRELQINTKMRYLYIPIEMVRSQKCVWSMEGLSEDCGTRTEMNCHGHSSQQVRSCGISEFYKGCQGNPEIGNTWVLSPLPYPFPTYWSF